MGEDLEGSGKVQGRFREGSGKAKTWKQPQHQRSRCLKIWRRSSGASPVESTAAW